MKLFMVAFITEQCACYFYYTECIYNNNCRFKRLDAKYLYDLCDKSKSNIICSMESILVFTLNNNASPNLFPFRKMIRILFIVRYTEYSNKFSQLNVGDSEREVTAPVTQNEMIEEIQCEISTKINTEIPMELNTEIASAPEESMTTISETVHYPQLIGVDAFEAELSAPIEHGTTTAGIKCKPFSKEQLKELYCNPEIPMAELFENEFITAELQSNHRDHPLYDLLMKYSKSRYNLMINNVDMETIRKAIPDDTLQFWNIESRNVRYSGKCKDGTMVNGSEFYNFAVLDEPLVDKVQALLTDATNLICTSSFSMYNSEIWRMEIERKIDELITSRQVFTRFSSNAPVALNFDVQPDLFEAIAEIRLSISILFCFTRRTQPDKVEFFSCDMFSLL